jgi:hypothetical protein
MHKARTGIESVVFTRSFAHRYKRDSWQIWENYAQVAQQAGFHLQATRALGQVSARVALFDSSSILLYQVFLK